MMKAPLTAAVPVPAPPAIATDEMAGRVILVIDGSGTIGDSDALAVTDSAPAASTYVLPVVVSESMYA